MIDSGIGEISRLYNASMFPILFFEANLNKGVYAAWKNNCPITVKKPNRFIRRFINCFLPGGFSMMILETGKSFFIP
jgi:hypothetical protein